MILNGCSFVHEKLHLRSFVSKGIGSSVGAIRGAIFKGVRELSNGEHVTRDKKRFINRLTQRGVVGT